MNPVKKDRQALRRRLFQAKYVILVREGWPKGTAWTMAKRYTDQICAEIKGRNNKESHPCPMSESSPK